MAKKLHVSYNPAILRTRYRFSQSFNFLWQCKSEEDFEDL